MKGRIRKLFAALLALALLAGCGAGTEGPASSEAPSPSSEVSAPAEENLISEEEAEVLDAIAAAYEDTFDGGSYADGDSAYPGGMMALGFLHAHGLLDPYWNAEREGWEIPLRVLGEVDQLFFSNLDPFSEEQMEMTDFYSESRLEPTVPVSLAREKIERLADGDIEVTYRRTCLENTLIPVTYRFRPFTLEAVPEALKDLYQPGETFYRLTGVTQREDLLFTPEPKTVEIATVEQLFYAVRRINEGGYDTRYDSYLLTADIDLAGVEWTPMGINAPICGLYQGWRDPSPWGFEGTFDGQGHTIHNLTITEEQGSALIERKRLDPSSVGVDGAGFFYRIGAGGVVKNLRLENANISLPLSAEKRTGSAALLAADCAGRVENVSVQGKVQGLYFVGGLVGDLVAQEDSPARMENCTADVEVIGWSTVGGLAGVVRGGQLENCSVRGSVTVVDVEGVAEEPLPQGAAGGLAGTCFRGSAVGCGVSVAVSGPESLEQIAGFCSYWDGGSVKGCWLDGEKAGGWEPIIAPYNPPTPMEIEIRS